MIAVVLRYVVVQQYRSNVVKFRSRKIPSLKDLGI